MRAATESPGSRPSEPRTRAASARKNGSKTLGKSAWSIPGPLSETANDTLSFRRKSLTRIGVCGGLYFAALLSKPVASSQEFPHRLGLDKPLVMLPIIVYNLTQHLIAGTVNALLRRTEPTLTSGA
jgi:hypothetical protein